MKDSLVLERYGWFGYLTEENIEPIFQRMQEFLLGKYYTFVVVNEYFGFRPEVRTDQQVERLELKTSDYDGSRYISVLDTYGVFSLSTGPAPPITFRERTEEEMKEVRKSVGLMWNARGHDVLEIEHFASAGNKLNWTIAIQHPQTDYNLDTRTESCGHCGTVLERTSV